MTNYWNKRRAERKEPDVLNKYKIVDLDGNLIRDGFTTIQAAKNMIKSLKLNRQDTLKVERVEKEQ